MRVFKRQRKIAGKVREDEKWTVEFRDHLDTVRRLVAFTDKSLSEEFGVRVVKLVDWRKLGGSPDTQLQSWLSMLSKDLRAKLAEWDLIPVEMAVRDKPLAEHAEAFIQNMIDRKVVKDHIDHVRSHVARILTECKITLWRDINEEIIQNVIAGWQTAGLSQQTANHYIRSIKQFTRWMRRTKKATDNPLEFLECGNVAADRRLIRRELSGDEITLLLLATRSGPVIFGLTGEQRAMLYSVALGTGLRANECYSLTAKSFKLSSAPYRVILGAKSEKNKKGSEQPLPADLVESLRKWLPTCPPGPLWPGTWCEYNMGWKLLKDDLAAARAAWLSEAENHPDELARRTDSDFLQTENEEGEQADFHALRHTYLSRLGRSGVSAKVMQRLARHSSVTITLDRYTHAHLSDLTAAVDKLPPLEAETPPQLMKATGTDGRGPLYGPEPDAPECISVPFDALIPVADGRSCRQNVTAGPHENTEKTDAFRMQNDGEESGSIYQHGENAVLTD